MQRKLDTNQTHARRAKNKKAFDAVISYYIKIRSGSTIKAVDSLDQAHATSNPTSPTPIDFICDVDTTVTAALRDKTIEKLFYKEYILEDEVMNSKEKAKIEQRVGSLFVSRKLWPVQSYFSTERKRVV